MAGSNDAPLILVGCRRSGTTLLTLMLDHHPSISMVGEVHFILDFLERDGSCSSVEEFCEAVTKDRRFKLWNVTLDLSLTYPEIVYDLIDQRLRHKHGDQAPIRGMCVHERFDAALSLWPNARFLHLVKDPRDVARSYVSAGWAGNTWYGAEPWKTTETQWASLRSKLPENRWMELKYEDLIQNPEGRLASICDYLGIPYSDAMLSYPEDTTYDVIDKSRVYIWRKKATERDVSLVEAHVGDLLVERGYETSDYRRPPVDRTFYRAWLGVEHRLKRLASDSRTYGLGLALEHFVARHVPISKWQDSTQLRVDAIINRNLK